MLTLDNPTRTELTPTQLKLVRASATLRASGDIMELEMEDRIEVGGKEQLVRDLKRLAKELWELAD